MTEEPKQVLCFQLTLVPARLRKPSETLEAVRFLAMAKDEMLEALLDVVYGQPWVEADLRSGTFYLAWVDVCPEMLNNGQALSKSGYYGIGHFVFADGIEKLREQSPEWWSRAYLIRTIVQVPTFSSEST